jgi:hypothetical protein
MITAAEKLAIIDSEIRNTTRQLNVLLMAEDETRTNGDAVPHFV